MRNLDFYEFAGILVPGILVLVLLCCLYPSVLPLGVTKDSPSAGAFGILVVIGYGAGHLVQAVSNLLEPLFWGLFGGMPTDWLRKPKQMLISEDQARKIQVQAKLVFAYDAEKVISGLSHREWSAMVRQMYAAVQAAGRASRVDTFNGNYGMLRGLTTALLIGIIALPGSPLRSWPLALALFGACVLAAVRMRRFAMHYARELFVQFLVLPAPTSIGAKV